MGREFTVRLTLVTTINPECASFQFAKWMDAHLIPRVLPLFVGGAYNHDNDVLTAIMVCESLTYSTRVHHLRGQALNIVVRMEPSLRYPSYKNAFFLDQETRQIGGGLVLWRGFFQSVRPAIGRMLININTTTGVMYQPGRLIDLSLEFLGRQGTPNALAPIHGLPDRERVRLQQFLSGIKITTPYRAQDSDRRRLVRRVTRESARDRTFEIDGGQTMTVMEYFRDKLNKPLQYPDLVCVEVCILFFLSAHTFSRQ
jgi:eukaryotic translation initiation factor 2C